MKRLKAGEISQQESATAQIDALQDEQEAKRVSFEIEIAQTRLRQLLGIGQYPSTISLTDSKIPACASPPVDELIQLALCDRPDAIASAESVKSGRRATSTRPTRLVSDAWHP